MEMGFFYQFTGRNRRNSSYFRDLEFNIKLMFSEQIGMVWYLSVFLGCLQMAIDPGFLVTGLILTK